HLDAATRRVAVRAVASSIVRTEDMHPNLAAVLRQVLARTSDVDGDAEDLDAPSVFLLRIQKLLPVQQRFVLRVLSVASVIGGRLTRREKGLLVDAHRACGLEPDLARVEMLRRAFLAGDPIDRQRIEGI